jgi:hypothetical protein
MANEITMQLQVLLKYTGVSDQYASGSKVVSQTSEYFIKGVQNIGTAATPDLIAPGAEIALATLGFFLLVNLDTANYVEVGTWDGFVFSSTIKLLAGEVMIARYSPSNISLPYAKANAAAVDLFYTYYMA